MNYDNTQVIIDLDAIEKNIDAVREKAGLPVMAIVKADAYGHGAIQVARLLKDKCAFFGVSSMLEAMELRRAGLDNPILILGYTPVSAFPTAIRNGIRPSIFHYEDALALSRTAVELGVSNAPFHFALDTGMSRIGFQATAAAADQCARIARLPGIFAEGLFTHFATADSADLSRSQKQAELFYRFDSMLRDRGVEIPIRHLDNSAGILNFSHPCEMVRSGIITYGLYPSDEVDRSRLSLTPALSWQCRITHLKLLEAGREISYGGTFVTTRPTMVATIPVGYADGYRRSLSGKFHVLIHGKEAPILGRVCMDQLMVDVTHIPETKLEDTVILIGKSGDAQITVEQIAAAADSFNYELVCGISRRVPRIYVSGGKIVNEVRYLLDS
ncbi:MAG: alanine racemase [Candidatus Faecousia sp.]|nr:alanine racemase [Candidatus Faecousia sp.]